MLKVRSDSVENDVAKTLARLREQMKRQEQADAAKRETRVRIAMDGEERPESLRDLRPFSPTQRKTNARDENGRQLVSANETLHRAQQVPFMAASSASAGAGSAPVARTPLDAAAVRGLGELAARRTHTATPPQRNGGLAQSTPFFGAAVEPTPAMRPMSFARPADGFAGVQGAVALSTAPSTAARDLRAGRAHPIQDRRSGPPTETGAGTAATLQTGRRIREALPPGIPEAFEREATPAPTRRGVGTQEDREPRRRLDPRRPGGPLLAGVMVPRDDREGREGWARMAPDIDQMDDMDVRNVGEIVFHHTGFMLSPRGVERLHRRGETEWGGRNRNFRSGEYGDVGYHYIIGEDGTIYEGRSVRYEGGHVSGHNPNTIGIAFLGDYTNRQLTRQQVASANALVQGLMQVSGRDRFEYSTHGEYDERKRNELRGAFGQLRDLERELAAVQAAVGRAPEAQRAALAARHAEAARREAQSARLAARFERLRYVPYAH